MSDPVWSDLNATDAGYHNLHAESISRIVKGGTWKKQDMVVIMPASERVHMRVVISWMSLIYPPNNAAHKVAALGLEVGQAYSETIAALLDHPATKGCRFFLTIEHDNLPPPDGLMKLLTHMEAHPELACIGGLYWTKGDLGVPQIWGDVNDPVLNFRPQPPKNDGLVECCGTGMGFNLWRTEMFRDTRLRRPWFKTTASTHEGAMTQDLYFWSDARKYGYRCAVACDVKVGHYDHERDFVW